VTSPDVDTYPILPRPPTVDRREFVETYPKRANPSIVEFREREEIYPISAKPSKLLVTIFVVDLYIVLNVVEV
jgi:hypothetical protein